MIETRPPRRSACRPARSASLALVGALLGGAALAAACHTPPPRPWLRYELAGPTEFTPRGEGVYGGSAFGADIAIDLHRPGTGMHVVVENPGTETVTLRIGPNAGAPRAAIGELLLRRLSGDGAGGPDTRAYAALQPIALEGGWRATFFLDAPLGREPQLGQYLVLVVEAANDKGEEVRRMLPVIARMSGTVPADADK